MRPVSQLVREVLARVRAQQQPTPVMVKITVSSRPPFNVVVHTRKHFPRA